MNRSYILKRGTEEAGPYSLEQLRRMEQSGELHLGDFLREDGSTEWKPANHVPGLFGRSMPLSTNAKVLIGAGAGCGLILAGLVGVITLLALVGGNSHSRQQPSSSWRQTSIEEQIRQQLTHALNEQKQDVFSALHPLGTAKSVTVHEVTIDAWRGGRNTQQWEDLKQFTVTFTLYWEGPIEKDGFTKVSMTYDNESQRYVSGRTLHTNGTTNGDVVEALGQLGGALLYDTLHSN